MLDRTTNSHGPVSAKKLEELRKVDAGSWFSSKGFSSEGSPSDGSRGAPKESFAGELIPTLDEILAFGRERDIGLYLEMKTPAVSGAELALVAALHASGEIMRTVVLSFDSSQLAKVRRYEPLIVTGHLCDNPAPDAVRKAVEIGARQLLPRADHVTAELLKEAHASDLKVVTWTVNDPEQAAALVAAGVDGIITDYPREMIALLACA
jgi:glycerophosphoryl diester phosphodiesterase